MKAEYNRIIKHIAFGCAWTLGGSIFAVPYLLRGEGLSAVFAIMLNWLIWGLLAPVIEAYDARLPALRSHWRLWTGGHLVFGAVLSVVYVAAAAALEYALGLNKWNPWKTPLALVDWYFWAILVYALIVGALQAVKYYRRHVRDELRIERLERRFAEARLQTLRAQLDPHFLFNALNGISADVERDPKTARRMIEHLAELLRLSLKAQTSQTVPLADELVFLDAYIALQRMRFGDRIKFQCDVPAELCALRVPSLLLQPLVENAVRHGFGGRVTRGHVWISAATDDGSLIIRVEDDGAGLPEGWTIKDNAGIGLSATRERLLSLYPSGIGRFDLYARPGGGIVAEARMPIEQTQRDVDAAA